MESPPPSGRSRRMANRQALFTSHDTSPNAIGRRGGHAGPAFAPSRRIFIDPVVGAGNKAPADIWIGTSGQGDMPVGDFSTRRAAATPDAIALDGSEVRLLCATPSASMALFTLAPGTVSKAVVHRSVEEIWYFTSGRGRMWRRNAAREEIVEIGPGLSIAIPAETCFQFRCDGEEAIAAVGVTVPPWPGADEARAVEGIWPATVGGGMIGTLPAV